MVTGKCPHNQRFLGLNSTIWNQVKYCGPGCLSCFDFAGACQCLRRRVHRPRSQVHLKWYSLFQTYSKVWVAVITQTDCTFRMVWRDTQGMVQGFELARLETHHQPSPKGPEERSAHWNLQRVAAQERTSDRIFDLGKVHNYCILIPQNVINKS